MVRSCIYVFLFSSAGRSKRAAMNVQKLDLQVRRGREKECETVLPLLANDSLTRLDVKFTLLR